MYTRAQNTSWLLRRVEDAPQVRTNRRETDTRTAVARGLAEYIQQLSFDGPGGSHVAFEQVEHTWGEIETPAKWPCAAILGAGSPGVYESFLGGHAIRLVDALPHTLDTEGTGKRPSFAYYAHCPAKFTITLTVEVWARSKVQRMHLCMMLEDELNPGGLAGFRLVLPHYHDEIASYAATTEFRYEESSAEAGRQNYKAFAQISAQCNQVRMVARPVDKQNHFVTTVNGVNPNDS